MHSSCAQAEEYRGFTHVPLCRRRLCASSTLVLRIPRTLNEVVTEMMLKRNFSACACLAAFTFSMAATAQTGTAATAPVQASPAAAPRSAPAPGAIAAHPEWPKANQEDVKSPEAIIAALSDSISGDAGKTRDWNRFRSLFVPGAGRMVVTRVPKTGPVDLTVLSMEDYIARSSGNAPQSFFEIPIAYDVQSFGRMTHVYESYGLYHARGEKPYVRGVNSFELLSDGTRYYVLQVYWDTERPDNPLPAKLEAPR